MPTDEILAQWLHMQGRKPRQIAEQGVDESSMSLEPAKELVLGITSSGAYKNLKARATESRNPILAETGTHI
jgi:hypothetical protein